MIPSPRGPRHLGAAISPACVDLGGVPRKGVYDNEAALVVAPQRPAEARPRRSNASGARSAWAWSSASPATPRPRAWSSGPTATWRRASCRAAGSPRRRTSTPSSPTWLRRANNRDPLDVAVPARDRIAEDRAADDGAAAGAARPGAGARPSASAATTGCGSAPATTRCTPGPSAVGSRSAWTSTRSSSPAPATRSPATRGRWAKHRTITDPAHELARKVMRAFAAAVGRRRRGRGPRPVGL